MDSVQSESTGSKLSTLNKKISGVRGDLHELDKEKEALFTQKKQLWDELGPTIQKIKQLKKELDGSTNNQKQLKLARDKANKRCGVLIREARELNKEKQKLFKKHGIKGDPQRLQDMIKKLDTKVETEVLTINQEKKVMTKIKELKKQVKENKVVQDVVTKWRKLSKEIDIARDKADELHHKLQADGKRKNKNYEEFISLSKKINTAKGLQKNAHTQFLQAKKKFSQKNRELKNELLQANKVNSQIKQDNSKKIGYRKQQEEQLIKIKEKEVEEKIKTKKKLTTKDLLVFQQRK